MRTPISSAAAVQTEQRFQTLFEQAPFSVQLLSVDGRTLKVNQAWKDLWGTHEGDPLLEFVLTEYNMLADAQLEAKGVTPHLRRAFAGEAVRLPAVHYDPAELGKPGLARWVEATARPIKAPDGAVLEVMLIHEDVTERLLAERQLRASEAQFRTIADAMPQMVWSTLPDGYHDYYNQQWYEFTGVPPGSTDGEAWNGMFHPEDQSHAWEVWRHSLNTGERYEIEYRLRHRSGEYRWVLGRALPVRNEQGEIVRWMGTCTDIHEQKQVRDELLAANRRKDDFLAMLAHELRNPLAPISTAAQLLKAAPGDPAKVERSAVIIERQVRHMTELVDDLLDVSRVTRGLVELERRPVEVKGVLGNAIEQVRPLIDARGHQLTTRMVSGDVYVLGDRTRLVQVVSNLLNNAGKYTPPNGSLWVSMAVGEHVEVRVADTGIGIEAQLLPHVFDLFTQGERTPDRAQGGLGLGLALVKSLVELHGGRVTAESQGRGLGSAFTVTLPLLKGGTLAASEVHQRIDVPHAPQALRVMIVDDNKDAAVTLGMLLESLGHEACVMHDPAQALEAVQDSLFNAFVLDIGLPGMDGYTLARRLRAQSNGSAATFVALTGYGSASDRHRGNDAGFDHYLVKPADLSELARLLHG
ncbi:PAS domain-containing hybrid sensor histidine kinase/response regulator [Ramlibacter tataouinensis]|uniref:histidine kinase n=1 Tax=Ramlibacter tataouinensis (strain ATCC BAA-407 / DSM 14655 / LMG 21543 / TTB310) TaxID=365046 RepID=F5XZ71_RAMTT|nr:PAS domain S-box protein [Ramlibacter tataouinensis]AEG93241.1 candidate histidine kinase, hybrid [Ramlibacter tataouinensis TTB310]